MPTFCRHNRLVSNCAICAREQNVALRPVVTGGHGQRGSDRAAAGPVAPTAPLRAPRSNARGVAPPA